MQEVGPSHPSKTIENNYHDSARCIIKMGKKNWHWNFNYTTEQMLNAN